MRLSPSSIIPPGVLVCNIPHDPKQIELTDDWKTLLLVGGKLSKVVLFLFPTLIFGLINSAGNRTGINALGVDDVLKDNAKYGLVGIVQSLTYITLITDNVLFVYSPRHL